MKRPTMIINALKGPNETKGRNEIKNKQGVQYVLEQLCEMRVKNHMVTFDDGSSI